MTEPHFKRFTSYCSLCDLTKWHSLEFLQGRINRIPLMAADCVGDHLRVKLARVVKAGRVERDQFRHRDECQIDWRSTGRAEGVNLFVPAISRNAPCIHFARNCYICLIGEGQIRTMTGPTSFLAITALAVILDDGLTASFITYRAAGASSRIGLCHCDSPMSNFLIGPAKD